MTGDLTPGFWARLLDYASGALRDARTRPEDRKRRTSDARFYINMSRLYDAPRIP
jgi:hypothetical protein